ncbi:hypothetical protein HRI_000778800 [Hibiscus trionum]|uniref:Uncharacterized protein n=1 Tax=Hibiscus trionum TaxID=183268 RepID=A0A9W7H849_HIBTR|nr:hypothetical protein HRI_000778800 [Hibiscus trionum]
MANEYSNFARNLGDGEIRLPSELFFNDVPSKCKPIPNLYHHHLPFSCMDGLAQRLSGLTLPNHRPNPPKANDFEEFSESIRYGSMNATGNEVSRSLHGFRPGPFLGGTKPVYEVQFLIPAKARVESFVEARARALQRQQRRLVQNRILPFQPNDFSNSNTFGLGGGLLRESGGTGVFHPRIVKTCPNDTTFGSRKKQSLRNRQAHQEKELSSGKMDSKKRVNVGKQLQQDCYYHLPAEMELPGDWTY